MSLRPTSTSLPMRIQLGTITRTRQRQKAHPVTITTRRDRSGSIRCKTIWWNGRAIRIVIDGLHTRDVL